VGARFGDQEPLTASRLSRVEKDDRDVMDALEKVDSGRFLENIGKINRDNRICGFPPLYALLKLTRAKRGVTLGYRQNIEGSMENMVSFTVMALYE
jgi:predicted class III extradiol MEMO1 family dioxygenase